MTETYNIYCDESCHLENDKQPIMVLGAVWCPLDKTREINVRIREIKESHGLGRDFEIKWTKVSKGKVEFYLDVMDYFFDDDDLHFRALIATGKDRLKHRDFQQDHDEWYYKMYFTMLKAILNPRARFRIYLDYKDTQSALKVRKLHEVLCHSHHDFNRQIIENVQTVRSEEVELIQLADLSIGTVSYLNRGLQSNSGKVRLVERMKKRSGYSLTQTTLVREEKVNIFKWEPQ